MVSQVIMGILPATSGDIIIDSMNIRNHLDEVRKLIGYCPQQNVFLESLTGRQHIQLFGMLKGVHKLFHFLRCKIPSSQIESEVHEILEFLGLTEKADQNVALYSGGMKRKINIGCAMIGKPKGM